MALLGSSSFWHHFLGLLPFLFFLLLLERFFFECSVGYDQSTLLSLWFCTDLVFLSPMLLELEGDLGCHLPLWMVGGGSLAITFFSQRCSLFICSYIGRPSNITIAKGVLWLLRNLKIKMWERLEITYKVQLARFTDGRTEALWGENTCLGHLLAQQTCAFNSF